MRDPALDHGSQGDVWDAQKDMLMDTIGGALTIVLFLGLRSRSPSARGMTNGLPRG